MKVHELIPDADLLCQESLNLLSQKIRAFFEIKFPQEELWFPDDTTQWIRFKKNASKVHIILYGNLLRSLAEMPYWPGENIYLWVMSESSKLAAIEILGLEPNQVSVIPRSLFDQANEDINPVTKKLIYAGRISRQKNILDLIWTLYFLQHIHSPEYQLTLFGSFDDEYNQDQGRMIFKKSFESEILSLVSHLKWKQPPRFEGMKKSLEWPSLLTKESTLISLSRFIMEDFGVSIAQAHEKGIATITSDWGGYKDIAFKNHLKVSSHLLSTDLTPLGMRLALTRSIANKIAKSQPNHSSSLTSENFSRPKTIDRSDLSAIHQQFVQQAGPLAVLLSRDQLAPYADSNEGKKLIRKIEKHFETQAVHNIVIIVSRLGTNNLEENQQLFSVFEKEHYVNSKKVILDGTQVSQKWAMADIMKSSEILVTAEAIKQFPQLKEVLKSIHSNIAYLEKVTELPLNLKEIFNFE